MSHRRIHTRAMSAVACLVPLGACTPGATMDSPPPATASPSAFDSRAAPASPSTTVQTIPTSEPRLGETRPVNANNWMSGVEGLPLVRSDGPTEALALTGIPAVSHEGLRRMMPEFSDKDTPGAWRGAWTDGAFEQGRGLSIQVEGDAALEPIINGTPVTTSENRYPGGTHTHADDLDAVSDGTSEDDAHVVTGAPTVRRFQIGFLSDPMRMAIGICD